ncbi:MAG: radical SAM protein [Desulfoprunum sp.]|nr:radical SAM protein [Desulfoprunum sp.]
MSCIHEHWGLEFSPEEIRETRARHGLLSMELELSRICNLGCIYCYAASGIPLDNELRLPELLNIVDQSVDLGVKKIIILGGGEPLLFPDLFPLIEYIRGKNLTVDLFTNATLLTREQADRLYGLQVGVVIKMNSRNPIIQDILAARSGTLEAIEQGLQFLKDAGYPNEEHVLGIETIICGHNYQELPDLWRWARRQNIIPYIETMTLQGRAKEYPDLEVPTEKIQRLFEVLADIDAKEFQKNWTPHPPLVGSQCARHEYSCTLTSTGDIHPCPGVAVSAGNIREQKLADILRQSAIIHDLRNIRSTIKGECSSCDLSDQCYGCRGHAYQVTGDYLAEDPLCWLRKSHQSK